MSVSVHRCGPCGECYGHKLQVYHNKVFEDGKRNWKQVCDLSKNELLKVTVSFDILTISEQDFHGQFEVQQKFSAIHFYAESNIWTLFETNCTCLDTILSLDIGLPLHCLIVHSAQIVSLIYNLMVMSIYDSIALLAAQRLHLLYTVLPSPNPRS